MAVPNQDELTDSTIMWQTLLQIQRDIGALEARVAALEARPEVSVSKPNVSTQSDMEQYHCPKVTMSKLVDKRLKMELWLTLGNGELSRYPHVTYVGEQETVDGFLPDGFEWEDMPFERDVDWNVTFKWGRKTGKLNEAGEETRYKDLVSIEEANNG